MKLNGYQIVNETLASSALRMRDLTGSVSKFHPGSDILHKAADKSIIQRMLKNSSIDRLNRAKNVRYDTNLSPKIIATRKQALRNIKKMEDPNYESPYKNIPDNRLTLIK